MKIMSYLICLVAIYSKQSMAMPWIFPEIDSDTTCSNIIKAAEKPDATGNDCKNFFPQSHIHSDKFEETCKKIMWEHIQDKNSGSLEKCKQQVSMIQEIKQTEDEKALEQIISTTSTPILPVAIPNHVSSAMVECNDTKEEFSCSIYDANLYQSLNDFEQVAGVLAVPNKSSVDTYENPKYSAAACKCLEQKLAADYESQHKKLSHRVLSSDLEKEKKKLNDIIFTAAGKKFINDFSSNLEDVRYYLTNNVRALHNDPARASALQCTNVKEYKEAMKSACAANNIDSAIRDQRIESFMGVFGDFSDKPSLEGKFKSLEDDILNSTLEVSKTRRSYDILRLGIVKSNPQVKFIDEITDFILEDPELTRELDEKIAFGEQPGHAIYELIRDESSPATQRLMQRITEKKLGFNFLSKNRSFYNNLKIASKTGIETDFANMVRDAYKIAIDQYPGFKAVFKDPALFRKIRDMKGPQRSLIEKLESNPSLLGNYYENNCDKMKEQFVQSVCAAENDYISKISPEDLNKYLTFTKKEIDTTLKDTVLCRTVNLKREDHRYSKLIDPHGNINLSDYLDRKSKPDQKRTSGYANYMKSIDKGNSDVTKLIQRISSLGEKERISSPEIASLIPLKEKIATPGLAGRQSSIMSDKNEESIYSKTPITNTNANPTASNAYLNPPPSAPSTSTKATKNNKALLRDFLADESNKAEVEKLLSNTSDEDLKELLKLKDEIAKDKERMNELVRETEKMKLKNLEQNLENLEKEMKTPTKVVSHDVNNYVQETPVFQGGSLSGSMLSKNGSMDNRDNSHFSDSSSGQASTSKGSSSSAAQITRSPASRTDSGPVKEASRGAIIIESKMVRVNDREFGQEDLSKEVISYVTQTDLDVQTLKHLKETGVVLKFKVLKDGVEVQQEMKVQYSALSAEARSILDKKIAIQEKSQEYQRVKRAHSFAALKLILGLKAAQERIN